MSKTISLVIILMLTILGGCQKNKLTSFSKFQIGELIKNENFTGKAWLNMLAQPDSLNTMYSGYVTFEKGARTNWHSHPSGQILIGVKGKGFYQEKGKPKQILIEGETVKSKPGVVHWHGATATNIFSHIAISSVQNGATLWLGPVSDNEFHAE